MSNTFFTTFLDEKFMPLKPKAKVIIMIFLILLPTVLFYYFLYQPNTKKIKNLENRITTLQTQIQNVKRKAADLAKFEKELEEAERTFEATATLLPDEKEIPQLLKDISSLGRAAGLDFLTFRPLADIPKDFYAEIPVTIDVRGPYHNMGFFFDQVSKLKRIVTVSNVRMGSPKKEGGEMLLKSSCRLVTYRFTNRPLAKPKTK